MKIENYKETNLSTQIFLVILILFHVLPTSSLMGYQQAARFKEMHPLVNLPHVELPSDSPFLFQS